MARTLIDASSFTYVAICTECGARTLPALDRGEALREARHHEMRAHPGDEQTRAALGMWEHRQASADTPDTRRDSSSVTDSQQSSQREPHRARRRRSRAAEAGN